MKISRNHLSVIAAASKDASRPVLNTVQFIQEGDETVSVATDSYRLYEVREPLPDGEEAKPEEILIPLETAKFAQVMIKPHKYLTHLDLNPEEISINGTSHKVSPQEGFPNYKTIMPKTDPIATVKFNPMYLKDAMDFLKGSVGVTLEFRSESQPLILRAHDGLTQKTALIMPMRG